MRKLTMAIAALAVASGAMAAPPRPVTHPGPAAHINYIPDQRGDPRTGSPTFYYTADPAAARIFAMTVDIALDRPPLPERLCIDATRGIGCDEGTGVIFVSNGGRAGDAARRKAFGEDERGDRYLTNFRLPAATQRASGQPRTNGGYLSFLSLSAVPEPAAWTMMVLGFGATGLALRRRAAIGRVVRA